mmetsp:Transcript_22578/g.27227  ORF Transcript_22578/g.27227 Transcript_22578/m.27227 type:complete len:742 (+) Transcript_22578:315-2540(+)|eukprot:CAMPEP_0197850730 /NCGR_PEP_ID=MMETSP1438-20131217/16202_1 /TAXON_ID=1461541 /ORGANISM="Pterosperma sp., Strain CCMP1384" /LENGTH=741 /DNA_ID=CAMNT_0043464039 /DNA_START=313 /DNA_END=2538 /DNA_ORIENTATION=-
MEASTSNAGANNLARKRSSAQPKKLIIKPFKEKPKLPPDFEDQTWTKLKEAVGAVHAKTPVRTNLEELYRKVEDLCIHKMAGNLYIRLEAECNTHLQSCLRQLNEENNDPVVFLGLMDRCWQDHCDQMLIIRNIFLYLDRTYVIQTNGIQSLWDMGLRLFRHHLMAYPEVCRRTVKGLLLLVERDRHREAVDRQMMKNLGRMLTSLDLYSEEFEKHFLDETQTFYTQEGENMMLQTDVSQYLQHVDKRLHEENERCSTYLDPSTRKPLIQAIEKQLLDRHTQTIIEKGYDALMDNCSISDLKRMYLLFERVKSLGHMKTALSAYVKRTGIEIVNDEEKDAEMVANLLELKKKLDTILHDSFNGNEQFTNTLKESFEHFINLRQNRPAEMIAKCIDAKLRTGNKGTSEDELESFLDRVLVLFRYIQGKDVFEAFYKKDLAKRLLLGKSASTDAEKSMIAKLKTECGSQFTNKLEGMFKDIDLSKDIMTSFRQSAQVAKRMPTGMEMSVHVLTTGFWPAYPPMEANLPEEISVYQEIFREFFLSKHSGRRLHWQNSLGHCTLRARFANDTKELNVSLFQTVILMLFNSTDTLSFTDIRDATRIQDKELRRTLQSLACGKVRVLLKEPKGRDVEDGDLFHFNSGFTHQQFRIKVNSIQMKESVEENQATTEKVFQDREYQIDAAIVRIMKTRKSLTHSMLVSELFSQLKFPMKTLNLKKRIESLIDREYLERDKNNAQQYNYLA